MTFLSIIAVFTGGMMGAVLRYELSRFHKHDYYIGTLLANLSGGLLLGWLVHIHSQDQLPLLLWQFLATGFCGGYTTYSTFSYELFKLFKKGRYLLALIYMIVSITATSAGIWIILN